MKVLKQITGAIILIHLIAFVLYFMMLLLFSFSEPFRWSDYYFIVLVIVGCIAVAFIAKGCMDLILED